MNIILFGLLVSVLAVQGYNVDSIHDTRSPGNSWRNFYSNNIQPIVNRVDVWRKNQEVNYVEQHSEIRDKLENIENLLKGFDINLIKDKINLIEEKVDKLVKQQAELKTSASQTTSLLQKLSSSEKKTHLQPEEKETEDTEESVNLDNFQKIGSKYYKFKGIEKNNWNDAEYRCHELGGHLASFKNRDEFDKVVGYLEEDNYWIDINDLSEYRNFISSTTGEEPAFLKWDVGEPNDFNDEGEHCVALRNIIGYYAMNDVPCEMEYHIICERN